MRSGRNTLGHSEQSNKQILEILDQEVVTLHGSTSMRTGQLDLTKHMFCGIYMNLDIYSGYI